MGRAEPGRWGLGNAAGKGFRHILMFARSAISFFSQHGWRFF